MAEVFICCPKCKWEPDGKPYWSCSCGTLWNTFATAGRCPDCGKVWKNTQCVGFAGGCDAWSPHLDWYNGLDDTVEVLKREVEEASTDVFKA